MKCGTCRHFKRAGVLDGAPKGSGNCHRFPPAVCSVGVNTPQGPQLVPAAMFPQVLETAYCGEYQPVAVANG